MTVNEDAADTVIDLAAAFADAEHSDADLTFSVTGNTDAGLFAGVAVDNGGDTLTLDFADDASGNATITVRATDVRGEFVETTFDVTINGVNDDPTIDNNTGLTVAENSPATTITSSHLSTGDIDNSPAQITYTLTDAPDHGVLRLGGVLMGTGGTFTQADVDGGFLTYTHGGGEPAAESFAFTVTDGVAAARSGTFAITITPVNDQTPVIISNNGNDNASVFIAETISVVTTVVATDGDLPAEAITYSIVGGTDAGEFSIDAATGELTFITPPDFESPTDTNGNNIYVVTVRASDGTLHDDQVISVNVTDVSSTLVVTTTSDTDDSGLGASYTIEQLNAVGGGSDGKISLREAIVAANNTAGTDTVSFGIATTDAGYTAADGGSWTIGVDTLLPNVTDTIVIDATTQAGYGTRPVIALDGSGAATATDGFGIGFYGGSDNSVLRGVAMHSFDGAVIIAAGQVSIQSSHFGTDVTGNVAMANNWDAVQVYNWGARIGGPDAADGNLFYGRWNRPVLLSRYADWATVENNRFGLSADGTTVFADTGGGIRSAAANVTIADNTFAGGYLAAIELSPDGDEPNEKADGTVIVGNRIGVAPDGTKVAGSGGGILVDADNVRIGTDGDGNGDAAEANIIAANSYAIRLSGGTGTTIAGNLIGTDGSNNLGVGSTGIDVIGGSGHVIGGTSAAEANVIGGSGTAFGINIHGGADGISVLGNTIGITADAATRLNNGLGILIADSTNVTIGGTAAGAGNTIAGSEYHGIQLDDADGFTIVGNTIGHATFNNLIHGIRVVGAGSNGTIGGTSAGATNHFIANGANAIGTAPDATGVVSILGNRFTANNNTIDLGENGRVANDNTLNPTTPGGMDYPTVTAAELAGGNLTVDGFIGTAAASADFAGARVEFYKDDSGDLVYLGFLTADADGLFSGTIAAPTLTAADRVVALATSSTGYTGEFGDSRDVDVAPELTLPTTTRTYVEDADGVDVAPDATFADADGVDYDGFVLTAEMTGAFAGDRLLLRSGGGITTTFDAAAAGAAGAGEVGLFYFGTAIGSVTGGRGLSEPLTLTFNDNATNAGVQAAIRAVAFRHDGDDPPTSGRTITFEMTDGSGLSGAPASVTVGVTAVNDAPKLTSGRETDDFSGGTSGWTDNTTTTDTHFGEFLGRFGSTDGLIERTFTTPDGADRTVITFDFLELDSWDNETFTVKIDENVVLSENFIGYFSEASRSGTQNGVSWTITSRNDGGLDRAFNATFADQVHRIELVIDNPNPTTKLTLSGGLSDTIDNESWGIDNLSIDHFGSVHDYDEDDGAVTFLPATLTVADHDDAAISGATVRIATGFESAHDSLQFTDQNGITGSYDAGTATLTLSGDATAVQYAAALQSVRFLNDSQEPSTADRGIEVTVADGESTSATLNATVRVNSINDAPSATTDDDADANAVTENATVGTTVGVTASATDADPSDSITYSLVDDDGGRFAIDANTGVVTVAGAIDREEAATRTIVVKALSTDGLFTTESFTIDVGDVDEFDVGPLTDFNTDANRVDEDAAANTVVGVRVQAADADATDNQITYTLDDDAGGRFKINAASGVVRVDGPLDFETATTHDIVVRATSDDDSFRTETFTIIVDDVNESAVSAVTDDDTDANAVAENAAGATVGITASATDPDGTDVVTYSLVDDAGGRFTIDTGSGVVTTAVALDRESAASHTITVRASSTDGTTRDETFTVAVVDVDEFDVTPIVDDNAAGDAVNENAFVGTSVGVTASAADADATTNGITYTLLNDAGGRFAIDAVSGVVTVADGSLLDHETAVSHTITVLATGDDDSTSQTDYTIAVNDVDEFDATPIVDTDPSNNTIAENAVVGTSVDLTASSVDADATNSDITYTLDDSAGGRFAIDAATGIVTVADTLDFETDTFHDITVRATSDDSSSVTRTFRIDVTDVNEGAITPVIDSDAATNAVAENQPVGATVGIVAFADDPDGTDTVSYLLDDDAGGRFVIDPNDGTVTTAVVFDREVDVSYDIVVRAVSTDGTQRTETFSITIVDVDEFDVTLPVDIDAGPDRVTENASYGTAVGITASASDADATNSGVTYSLADDDGGRFRVDAGTGVVTVNGSIDREDGPTRQITVRATSADGSTADTNYTIAVDDVDEFDVAAAGDTDGGANVVDENSAAGTTVGVIASAVDADGTTNAVTYALVDDAGGRFVIDWSSGTITVASGADLDHESIDTHDVVVRATSADGSTVDQTYTIAVADINDAPIGGSNTYTIYASETAGGNVLGNDTDQDGDTLTAILNSGPGGGSVNLNADGSFTYTPSPSFFGTDTFTYLVTDGTATSGPITVTISVLAGDPGTGDPGDGDSGDGEPGDEIPNEAVVGPVDPESAEETPGVSTVAAVEEPAIVQSAASATEIVEASERRVGGLSRASLETQTSFVPATHEFQRWAEVVGGGSAMTGPAAGITGTIVFVPSETESSGTADKGFQFAVETTTAAASLLGIGATVWILRGGALLTALASGGSSWKMIDPAAMLSAFNNGDGDAVDRMV